MSATTWPWQDVQVCSACSTKSVHVPTLLSNMEKEMKEKVSTWKRNAETQLMMPVTVPQLACVQGIYDRMRSQIDSSLRTHLSDAKRNVASQLQWCHGEVDYVPQPAPKGPTAALRNAEEVKAKEQWIEHLRNESADLRVKERQYLRLANDRKENVGISGECCNSWQALDHLIEKLDRPVMTPDDMNTVWKEEGDYVEEEEH